ncbi:hypothetical protein [Photobacterium chitinilyticum]|nr:hypothetical protein [Photobacterium chitinilyticum]
MKPSVYLYNETNDEVELYLGEFSTIQGLVLFDLESEFRLISFGATCYKNFDWVTEKELPEFSSIREIVSFLKKESDISIVDFESELPGLGSFSTHDDGECHFKLKSKHSALSILQQVAPEKYRDMLINQLLNNQKFYITCDNSGNVRKFGCFDDYLSKNT